MRHPRSHPWRSALVAGTLLGLVAASLAMAAAWQHNPQGEFHDAAAVHWAAWLSVGASWLGVVGAGSALACRALLLLVDRWAPRQRDRSAPGS